MKSIIFSLIIFSFILFPGSLLAEEVYEVNMPKGFFKEAKASFDNFNKNYNNQWQVEFNQNGTIRKIYGFETNPIDKLDINYETLAKEFLKENYRLFFMPKDLTDLTTDRVTESLGGWHVVFQQNYKNLPLEGVYTYLHFNKLGQIQLIDNEYIPNISSKLSVTPKIRGDEAIYLAKTSFENDIEERSKPSSSLVVYPYENKIYLAWKVTLPLNKPFGDYVIFVNAGTGKIISKKNIFFTATGKGQIWPQNPIDTPNLEIRKLENLDGSGNLKGKYVDAYSSSNARAESSTLEFIYEPTNPHFEEVMVYYHIDTFHTFLNKLGYSNVRDYATKCDVHNKSIGDNAGYSPTTDSIVFGGTKYDFAEDGDVIIHEYGHAIQFSLKFTGGGSEGGGIHEGNADYFAGTYFNDAELAEYASKAFSPTAGKLRDLNNTKTYPNDMTSEPHSQGEVWGPTMWDMRKALGPNISDYLVIEGIANYNNATTFCDAYKAIQLADKNLYNSSHKEAIKQIFINRGIIQADESCTENSSGGRCLRGTLIKGDPTTFAPIFVLLGILFIFKLRKINLF